MTAKLPVVILISGRGTNMCVLADLAHAGRLPIDIKAVVSDRAEAPGLALAKERGIPTATLSLRDFPSREAFDVRLTELVASFKPDLVVLAGYMKVLSQSFVQHFANRLINIHPSLLPKYPGLHTHRRALESKDLHHGATVHFVVEELDSGPSVIQGRIPVPPSATEASLAARVHEVEYKIYPQAVEWFATGRLRMRDGHAWLDGQPLHQPVLQSFE